MKVTFFLILTCFLGPSAYAQTDLTSTSLVWHTEIQSALVLAKKEHKNVMVMVGEDTCRWCVKMKKGTLSNIDVQKSLQKFILIKIDRNDNESMEKLEGLRGPIPSFHFFTPQKKRIDTIAGYYQIEDFLGYINEIIEDTF